MSSTPMTSPQSLRAKRAGRSESPAATARWHRWPTLRSSGTSRSSSSPSEPGTTSRATWVSTRDDPLAALSAFSGREERIDVGRANGRLFLNNVSLGLYAGLVHRREGRDAVDGLKALGLLLRRPRGLGVSIDRQRVHARVVLVSNNRYELDLFSLGERERLDEGSLHCYVAHGWLPRTWEEQSGEHFVVDARAGRMRAAVDGEPEELETPLRFEIQPRALRVLLPQN